MVGDDDLQSASARLRDLLDRRHSTVDREHEATAFVGEPGKRLALEAVALLEAARQVPDDVGAQLAEDEDRERRGADPIRVVVAVYADSLAAGDRRLDRLDGAGHVAEQKRIVTGQCALEER